MSFDKLFPSNIGKFPWSINKVRPSLQRNSPIIVYFPFQSMQETRAYWNYSCGATTEPWHTQPCGELQPCIFHLAWQGADDRRGERDRGHYHRQQQKKRKKPRDVCRVGRTEFFRRERSHGPHLSQIPTHAEPGTMSQLDRLTTCDVTSAARGGKGGNVDALFFKEQWRKSERDFFLTFEGISVRYCKEFFSPGLRFFFLFF